MPYQIIWSWYTGRWWVGCYVWYSDEGTGRDPSPPRPLIAVPNVTAHPSTASVPITVLLYNDPLLCGFNVPIKGLNHLIYTTTLQHQALHLIKIPADIAQLQFFYTRCNIHFSHRLSFFPVFLQGLCQPSQLARSQPSIQACTNMPNITVLSDHGLCSMFNVGGTSRSVSTLDSGCASALCKAEGCTRPWHYSWHQYYKIWATTHHNAIMQLVLGKPQVDPTGSKIVLGSAVTCKGIHMNFSNNMHQNTKETPSVYRSYVASFKQWTWQYLREINYFLLIKIKYESCHYQINTGNNLTFDT